MSNRAPAVSPIEPLESRRLLSVFVGLQENNRLVQFRDTDPSALFKGVKIKGLSTGDRVVGIDFRPANGELYGLVNGSTVDRVIKINPTNGKTTTTFTLTTALSGQKFGVNFNPAADALRVTSNTGQNLRIPFASGATVVDGAIAYDADDINGTTAGVATVPNVVASAYSNSVAGATSTILYNVDAALDTLTVQNPPNAGTQVTRGPLGVNTSNIVGFDVEPSRTLGSLTNNAFVTLKRVTSAAGAPEVTETFSRLYRISLATGATTDVGVVGGATSGRTLRAIAIVPTGPTLTTQALAATAAPAAAAEDRDSVNVRDSVIV